MKVTAGFAKGMAILAPPGMKTRPTSDKVKQAVWNTLQTHPVSRMLDAFAGSGGMGLEALSRGTEHVVFVESDKRAASIIAKNLQELERRAAAQDLQPGRNEIVRCDVEKAPLHGPFDLIYMDPPYDLLVGLGRFWLAKLGPLLATEGMLLVESRKSLDYGPLLDETLEVVKTKAYGDTMVTYIGLTEGTDEQQ